MVLMRLFVLLTEIKEHRLNLLACDAVVGQTARDFDHRLAADCLDVIKIDIHTDDAARDTLPYIIYIANNIAIAFNAVYESCLSATRRAVYLPCPASNAIFNIYITSIPKIYLSLSQNAKKVPL